jgi:hypothetical protein
VQVVTYPQETDGVAPPVVLERRIDGQFHDHGRGDARAMDVAVLPFLRLTDIDEDRASVQFVRSLLVDGRYRIVSQPPIVVPARELEAVYGMSSEEVSKTVREQLGAYRATLQDNRRDLLERFEIVDIARKVVGVGSVGTRAYIVLLEGRDTQDPLFLQVKEATASVLEDHLPKSRYEQPGARVVHGQRMMQAVSDIFLG